MIAAVIFDVDFTLIHPGPMFQGEGYRAFGERHLISVDSARFDAAVASASSILDESEGLSYDAELFIAYTRHIIEQMGGSECGTPESLTACARDLRRVGRPVSISSRMTMCRRALRALTEAGVRIGLISNSHRCLDSFQSHFELREFVSASVSSAEHGFMKPHPSIFQAALQQLRVTPGEAVMVGDSVSQDIEGALKAGMRAILLHRSETPAPRAQELRDRGVPIIRSLRELNDLLFEQPPPSG